MVMEEWDESVFNATQREFAKVIGDALADPAARPPAERIPGGFESRPGLASSFGPSKKIRLAGQLAEAGYGMQQLGAGPGKRFVKFKVDRSRDKIFVGKHWDPKGGKVYMEPPRRTFTYQQLDPGGKRIIGPSMRVVQKTGYASTRFMRNIRKMMAAGVKFRITGGWTKPVPRKQWMYAIDPKTGQYTKKVWAEARFGGMVARYEDKTLSKIQKSVREYGYAAQPVDITPREMRKEMWRNLNASKNYKGWLQKSKSRGVLAAAQALGEKGGLFNIRSAVSDGVIPSVQALENYINLVTAYVREHAGGIIGDNIKFHYFNAGYGDWPGLHWKTYSRKKDDPRIPEVNVMVPMWGVTYRGDLPNNWRRYTYRWGNWGGTQKFFSTRFYGAAGGPLGQQGRAKMSHPFAFEGKPRGLEKGEKFYYGGGKQEGKQYATGIASFQASLMDITATLMPYAWLEKPSKWMGTTTWRAAALRAEFGKELQNTFGRIRIYGAVEPYSAAPWVFVHEFQGHRQFITPGLRDGFNEIARLGKVYLDAGPVAFKKHLRMAEPEMMQDPSFWSEHYAQELRYKGPWAGVYGDAGNKMLPLYWKIDLDYDNLITKLRKERTLMQKFFGNRMMWWFMPPSKYWHYVGMGSDIKNIFFGGFIQSGAVMAMLKAMAIGIAGARLGSPVPFTSKARRRKFRKGMYSRAGYHRQYVGYRT